MVATLLRVARVIAGLVERKQQYATAFMTRVTCRLTAKNRDQLQNPTLGSQVWATFTFLESSHRCLSVVVVASEIYRSHKDTDAPFFGSPAVDEDRVRLVDDFASIGILQPAAVDF